MPGLVGAALQELRTCKAIAFPKRRKSFFFQEQRPHLHALQVSGIKNYTSPWLCLPPFPPSLEAAHSLVERPQVTVSSHHPGLSREQLNCQTCSLVGARSGVLSAAPSSLSSFVLVFLTDGYNKSANGFPALKKKKKATKPPLFLLVS